MKRQNRLRKPYKSNRLAKRVNSS